MDRESDQTVKSVYLFNSKATSKQLFNAISVQLSKAEALALMAATMDLGAFDMETVNNYMWALSDLIREVKSLHERTKLIT